MFKYTQHTVNTTSRLSVEFKIVVSPVPVFVMLCGWNIGVHTV
jgi:hypothetical protein